MKAVKTTSSVLLCLIAFFLLLWAAFGFSIKGVFTKDNLTSLLANQIKTDIIQNTHQSNDLVNETDSLGLDEDAINIISENVTKAIQDYVNGANTTNSLSDAVYSALSTDKVTAQLGEVSISRSQVETLMEESTVTEFVADYAADYAGYMTGGDAPEPITSEKLITLVDENVPVIEKAFDVTISDETLDNVHKVINSKSESISAATTITTVADNSSLAGISSVMRILLSDFMLIFCIVAAIILISLTAILNKSIKLAMLYGGITLTGSGIILALCGAFSGLATTVLPDVKFYRETAQHLISSGMQNVIAWAIVLVITGVMLISAYFITKLISQSKQQPAK